MSAVKAVAKVSRRKAIKAMGLTQQVTAAG
jgi:hypothetical protein